MKAILKWALVAIFISLIGTAVAGGTTYAAINWRDKPEWDKSFKELRDSGQLHEDESVDKSLKPWFVQRPHKDGEANIIVRRLKDSVTGWHAYRDGGDIVVRWKNCRRARLLVPGDEGKTKDENAKLRVDNNGSQCDGDWQEARWSEGKNTKILVKYGYRGNNSSPCENRIDIDKRGENQVFVHNFNANHSNWGHQDNCHDKADPDSDQVVDVKDKQEAEAEGNKLVDDHGNAMNGEIKDKQTGDDKTVASEDGEKGDEEKSSCVIDGIGWIVCPASNFLATITDMTYGAISGMLTTPAKIFDEKHPVYQAWSQMRNISNIGFAIMFIIIIISHLTSIGFSNYSIKRMLPRLILAAVLVNLSFYICALVVDLSNILGASMKDFIGGVISVNAEHDASNDGTDLIAGITAFILSAGAIGAGTAIGLSAGLGASISALWGILFPLLIAALIAVFIIYILLVARQAIIVLLIIISPLAFLAYLLPNTEDLFTRWRKIFTTMLLMYPTIALIFGACELVSNILLSLDAGLGMKLAGVFVKIIPLALTPLIMRTGGNLISRLSGVNFGNFGLNRIRQTASETRARNLENFRNSSRARSFATITDDKGNKRYKRRFTGYITRQTALNKARRETTATALEEIASETQSEAIYGNVGNAMKRATGDSTLYQMTSAGNEETAKIAQRQIVTKQAKEHAARRKELTDGFAARFQQMATEVGGEDKIQEMVADAAEKWKTGQMDTMEAQAIMEGSTKYWSTRGGPGAVMAAGNAEMFRDAISYKINNNIHLKNEKDQIIANANQRLETVTTEPERQSIIKEREEQLKEVQAKYQTMGNWLPSAYFGGGGSGMGMITGMASAKGVTPEKQARSMSMEQLAGTRDLVTKQEDGSYKSFIDVNRAKEALASESFNRFVPTERLDDLRAYVAQEVGKQNVPQSPQVQQATTQPQHGAPVTQPQAQNPVNVDDVAQRAADLVRQQNQTQTQQAQILRTPPADSTSRTGGSRASRRNIINQQRRRRNQ